LFIKKKVIYLHHKTIKIEIMTTQITKKELLKLLSYTENEIVEATNDLKDDTVIYGKETVADQAELRIKELITLQHKLTTIYDNN